MNKLNPLYILLFFITLLILSYIQLNIVKKDYEKISSKYENFKIDANNFKEYKKTWFNQNRVTKKLDNIVKSTSFRKEKILKAENSNIIKVKIESSSPIVLSKFLNRVLNEKFIIKKLDIKKRSILIEIGVK